MKSFSEREAALRQIRNLKMAESAHAYVRGNTLAFYEWLGALDSSRVPQGPPVWICGDCHVGNLGPLADTDGEIDIEIRDLDQTVIGNPAVCIATDELIAIIDQLEGAIDRLIRPAPEA